MYIVELFLIQLAICIVLIPSSMPPVAGSYSYELWLVLLPFKSPMLHRGVRPVFGRTDTAWSTHKYVLSSSGQTYPLRFHLLSLYIYISWRAYVSSVSDVLEICYNYFILMLQKKIGMLHMLQWLYTYVSSVGFKCFICFRRMLQCFICMFHTFQWLYTHVASVCFKCFICFKRMLQVFYLDVAYVVVAIHICCKRMLQIFHQSASDVCCRKCFYVASVS